MPYINNGTGRQNQQVSLYYVGVPLQPGKTVQYVTLPNVSQGAASGQTAMHIFAMGFGCCSLTFHAPGTVTAGQSASAQTVLTNASTGTATNATGFMPPRR